MIDDIRRYVEEDGSVLNLIQAPCGHVFFSLGVGRHSLFSNLLFYLLTLVYGRSLTLRLI